MSITKMRQGSFGRKKQDLASFKKKIMARE